MSAESGIGWIPLVLEALEYHFHEMVTDDGERRFAKRRPNEYETRKVLGDAVAHLEGHSPAHSQGQRRRALWDRPIPTVS